MEDRQQITALIKHSVADLKRSGRELTEVTLNQFPVLPRLRATPRYITKTLGVCFNNSIIRTINNGVTDVKPIRFFIRMRLEKRVKDFTRVRKALGYKGQASIWCEISEDDFIKYTVECCTTPRKLVRALARMDSYVRWMQDRIRGLEAARENILIAQQPWVDKINARISGIELSGANLSVNGSTSTRRIELDNPIKRNYLDWP